MVPATVGIITLNILMFIFVVFVAIFISLYIYKTHAPYRYDPCNHICTNTAADSDFSLTGLKPFLAFQICYGATFKASRCLQEPTVNSSLSGLM